VSDQFGLAIHRYDLDGKLLGTFGDASLDAAYREIEELRGLYRKTISSGQLFLIANARGSDAVAARERRSQERLGASLAVQAVEHAKPDFSASAAFPSGRR